jgi:hypothetical protein
MPPALADVGIKVSVVQFKERLDREVRAAATLSHSNICTPFDARPKYLVMELAEGEAPKGSLPLDETCASRTHSTLPDTHTRHLLPRMRAYRLRE